MFEVGVPYEQPKPDAIQKSVKVAIDSPRFEVTANYEFYDGDDGPRLFATINATTSDPFIAAYKGWALRPWSNRLRSNAKTPAPSSAAGVFLSQQLTQLMGFS